MRQITMEYKEYREDLISYEKLGFNLAIESILRIINIKDNDEKFSELLKVTTGLKYSDYKTCQLAEMVGIDKDYTIEKLCPKRKKN